MASIPSVFPDGENEITHYGAAARNDEIDELVNTIGGIGKRKQAIKHAAYKLFQVVAGGHLPSSNAEDALWTASRSLGVSAEDRRLLIDKGMREGMARPRHPRRVNLAGLLDLAEERYTFTGQTGATDYAVYCAHLRVATGLGSLVYCHSCRQLAEEAGIGAMDSGKAALTVSRSNKRLAAGGLLRELRKGQGVRSSTWQLATPGDLLRIPVARSTPLFRIPADQPLASGVLLATGLTRHQVWDRRGLGPTAKRVYGAVVGTALTTTEIAQVLNLHRGTVYRNLVKLDEYRMVRRLVDHWTAIEVDLDQIADDLDVGDVGARRKQAHADQRKQYRYYLRMKKAGADPRKRATSIMTTVDPEMPR